MRNQYVHTKQARYSFVIAILFLLLTSLIQKEDKPIASVDVQDPEAKEGTEVQLSTATQSIPKEEASKQTPSKDTHKVVRVIDGDTIDVQIVDEIKRIRLIGIDTPETVKPNSPIECFGIEASNKAKELLNDAFVSLERDDSQDDQDKYGRLLRYVFLEDGTHVNETMIQEGYAYEYTYNLPYMYQAAFKKAEEDAREEEVGLWGAVCDR